MGVLQRISPRVVIGAVSGYLFCDSFDKALTLLWPIFGVHLNRIDVSLNVFAPLIVPLAITLALGSRRAWVLTQVYLLIRILVRAVLACITAPQFWPHYSSPTARLPNGTSPGVFVFSAIIFALNVLISIVLLLLLRRPDVRSLFDIKHVEPI
jgi:hypothetical protein